jgi:glycosyltransferase involved in cell wall biosynthesis
LQKIVALINFVQFLNLSRKYRYQIHYGVLTHPIFIERYLEKLGIVTDEFHLGLWFMNKIGKKIVYVPSGCRDEELRSVFQNLDEGNVCNNCGFADRCSDDNVLPNLKRAQKYAHLNVGLGFLEPSYLRVRHFKYKSIDLNRWKPCASRSNSAKIRVIHSHSLETRSSESRNIKGSPEIIEVMKRIEKDLPNVEFIEVTGLTTQEMLAEQQEADVIIDQIRYGHWGSTGVEAMALGKVLVCYVRPSWEENFFRNFPEYSDLPIVNANEDNLYDTMFRLLNDEDMISSLKNRSRSFAESHYDPSKNVLDLIKSLEEL